jgi:hypothetical protein
MAHRRSAESLARWAEQFASVGAVPVEDLLAELRRRSTKLDESETEDEQRERESLDRDIREADRRVVSGPAVTKDQRLFEVYDRRGMDQR